MGKGNPALVFVLIGAFLISFLTAAAVYSYLMIQGKVMPPIDYDLSHAIEDENLMTSLRGKSKSLRLQQDSVGWPQGTKFVNLHDAVRRAREKNEVIMVFYTEEWCEATKTFKSLLRRNPEFVDVSKDLIMVATDGRHHAPEETMLPEDVPRAYMTKRGATPNDPCYIPMSLGGGIVLFILLFRSRNLFRSLMYTFFIPY